MSIDRNVGVKAADGCKLTLGELRQFVTELDEAGAAESTTISGRVGWRGSVKALSAVAVRFGDPVPG